MLAGTTLSKSKFKLPHKLNNMLCVARKELEREDTEQLQNRLSEGYILACAN